MTDVGILGSDAVRGDPGAMGAVAGFLRLTAQQLDDVRSRLEHHGFEGAWEGAAADAFQALLRTTPEDLSKAARSYDHAADAVAQYQHRLQSAHDSARQLADRLAALLGQAAHADGAERAARQAAEAARRAVTHAVDPAARAQATHELNLRLRALADAEAHRRALHDQIDAVRRQAADNRRGLDAAAQVTHEQLAEASRAGIRNSVGSWLDRHADDVRKVRHVAWRGLEVAAATLVDAYHLVGAVRAYLHDPSWDNLSKVLDDLSAALTVLTVVLTIAVVVLTAGAALAFVPEIIVGLKVAQVEVDVVKLGVDMQRRRVDKPGEVTDIDLGVDAANVVFDAVGAKGFSKEASGWIHALHTDQPSAWRKWAVECVVIGHGKPLSWTQLHAIEQRLPAHEARELDGGVKDLAQDWANEHVPVLGRDQDFEPVRRMVRSSAAELRHRLTLPRLDTMVQPAGGGGAW